MQAIFLTEGTSNEGACPRRTQNYALRFRTKGECQRQILTKNFRAKHLGCRRLIMPIILSSTLIKPTAIHFILRAISIPMQEITSISMDNSGATLLKTHISR